MAPFRAITLCVFTLSAVAGALAGQANKPGKARTPRSIKSSLFTDPQGADYLTANRVGCYVNNSGGICGDPETEDGNWPLGSVDTYIFQAGLQLVGLIPLTASVWAGDTVGAFFMDFRGDQVNGSGLSLVFNSRDTSALRQWPSAALIRDPSIFATPLLGQPSASSEDLWTRYWDGAPGRNSGRKHPMGVVVDQRVMQFNGPGYNSDILYFVFTITNVTASDPTAYATIDPAVRGDYAALGAKFKQTSDSIYGVSLPTSGIVLDSVFVNAAMDPDVGADHVAQNYSTPTLPFSLAFAYEAPFNEPSWAYPLSIFGAPGLAPAPGLVGVKYLRFPTDSAGRPVGVRIFSNHSNSATGYPDPVGTQQLYRYLSGTPSPSAGDNPCQFQGEQISLQYCQVFQVSQDTRFDFSSGPFRLAPGQQQDVVLAYVFAAPQDTVTPYIHGDLNPGFPAPGDSIAADSTKVRLIERVAGWVTQKDLNSDGVIEENEVTTWPGSLLNKAQQAQAFADAKFLTPQPPVAPPFFLIPGNNSVTVVWQKSPSETAGDPYYAVSSDPTSAIYDPNFRRFDLEGYRIYRGLSPATLQVVAQFDYAGTEMEDYLGDFDYGTQCAPELSVVAGCPVPFTGTPTSAIHQPHPLVGDVVQVPLGGRLVSRNGAVGVTAADTAVTGGATGFPSLVDNGVTFTWTDHGAVNSFHYYYAVTAFTVNSVRSGPSSLESPRVVKSVQPRAGVAIGNGSVTAARLLAPSGATLLGVNPTLDPATGEFSGPEPPTNGLSLSLLSFLPELLDTGSLTLRVDSILPGIYAVDYGAQQPATYFLSGIDARGQVTPFTLPLLMDNSSQDASASTEFSGAPAPQSKAAIYGGDSTFALEAAASLSAPGTWLLTSPGRGAVNNYPSGNSGYTGNRWWAGAANENHALPTSGLCIPAIATCTRTTAQLVSTGGVLPGVSTLAPIVAYSTVRNIPQRDVETMTSTVYRAADFNVYWGTAGKIDSVIDVTHDLPVPFSPKLRASWGILDSTSFTGITDDPDTNPNVLTWSDVACVDPLNIQVAQVVGAFCANPAPLVSTAHLSTTATATGDFGAVPASQGPGFIFYLAGQFWIMSMATLPASGTVWHARYLAGAITGTPGSLAFTPADYQPPAVPGLRIQLSYTGSSIDLTHTTDSALARIHTVPDPFYVTDALATSADSQHIEFVHLPPEAIIRIYSVSGRLVVLLTHNDPTGGGEESWNVRSRDGKTVASGVYFYAVETADGRSKIGRFTVVTYRP